MKQGLRPVDVFTNKWQETTRNARVIRYNRKKYRERPRRLCRRCDQCWKNQH